MEASGEVHPIKQQSNPDFESSSCRESEVSGRNYSELKAEDPPTPSLSEVEDAVTSAKESPPGDLGKAQQHQSREEVKAEEGSTHHEDVKVAVPSSPSETVKADEPHAEVKTAVIPQLHEEVKAVKPQDELPKLIVDAGDPLAGTPKPSQAEQPLQSTLLQQQANPSTTKPHYPEAKPEVQSSQVKSDPISVNKSDAKSEGSQTHVKEVTTPVDSKPVSKMEDQPPSRQRTLSRLPKEGRTHCARCRVF
jgi:hypothetical protein